MSIFDWLKREKKKRPKKEAPSSATHVTRKPSGKQSKTESEMKNVVTELESERVKNKEQEKRIREMEERFNRMQDQMVSLLEKQQMALEDIANRDPDTQGKDHPADTERAIPSVKDVKDDGIIAQTQKKGKEGPERLSSSPILKEKTLENFVVDDSNRFPYLAAEAVATGVGKRYNPLFIYGPVGVGKTHLLHGIANKMMEYEQDITLLYSSTERFTDELVRALESDDLEGFRSKYRDVDVLLVDDIQMLSGKEATQQEFFHMFNHLYNSGKQIVLCSDRPPSEIKELESRLRSRFEGGLIIDIKVPTFEGRRQILLNLSNRDGFSLSTEVMDYMAFYMDSNVRELEGGFNRVTAYASLMKEPITVSLVRKVLEGVLLKRGPGKQEEPMEAMEEAPAIAERPISELENPYSDLDLEEETDRIERELLSELKKDSGEKNLEN